MHTNEHLLRFPSIDSIEQYREQQRVCVFVYIFQHNHALSPTRKNFVTPLIKYEVLNSIVSSYERSNDIMGKTRNGKAAVICTAVAFVLIVIAFTTPNWLETDGKLENPKFIKIGNLL